MALKVKKDKKNARPEAAELRKLSPEELKAKLSDEREALMRARFRHAAAQLENTSELRAMRRQIARIETVMNEKEPR